MLNELYLIYHSCDIYRRHVTERTNFNVWHSCTILMLQYHTSLYHTDQSSKLDEKLQQLHNKKVCYRWLHSMPRVKS